MKRLLVLVEGQTEETFFNSLLQGHLAALGVAASCTMICTSREEGRRANRGGHLHKWRFIERDLRLLLRSRPDAVTTMLDLYGFPPDIPGFPSTLPPATSDRVKKIGAAISAAINDSRFIPGILAHEFEALLFTAPPQIAEIAVDDEDRRQSAAAALQAIAASFPSPEDIDDSPETAPSKRILREIPGYEKPRHGPVIAARVGLPAIRARCPSFSDWLGRLESLGG